jgi:transposase-like protein
MSTQRFTPDFKEEAVKQAVERGYSVPYVAARLGFSAHSLYKWVKAVSLDKSEQHSKELLQAKSEILRLRARMRRVEEARDLLKKPRGILPRTVKYRFMNEQRHEYPLAMMCRALHMALCMTALSGIR